LSLCDNFLYGFKVAACRPRRLWCADAEAARDARETPADARGLCLVMGCHVASGLASGAPQSQGAALASPPPLRGGATGAAASRPVCRPDRSARGPRRHERASWQRANSQRPRPPGRGAAHLSPGEDQKQTLAAGQRVRGDTTPSPFGQAWEVSENLSRALRVPSGWPTATLDRTSPTGGSVPVPCQKQTESTDIGQHHEDEETGPEQHHGSWLQRVKRPPKR
jgi:hypothetical protein